MNIELDAVAITAGAFTAVGVGIKSLWDRFWNRRDRIEERKAARDEVHRGELRDAYVELITAFHKMIDDGFAVVSGFLEAEDVHIRMLAAKESTTVQNAKSGTPISAVMTEYTEVEERATNGVQVFFDSRTSVMSKGTAVQLLDDDTIRGQKIAELCREPIPVLETNDDAPVVRAHLREQLQQFNDVIATLGGAFAPSRWAERRADK